MFFKVGSGFLLVDMPKAQEFPEEICSFKKVLVGNLVLVAVWCRWIALRRGSLGETNFDKQISPENSERVEGEGVFCIWIFWGVSFFFWGWLPTKRVGKRFVNIRRLRCRNLGNCWHQDGHQTMMPADFWWLVKRGGQNPGRTVTCFVFPSKKKVTLEWTSLLFWRRVKVGETVCFQGKKTRENQAGTLDMDWYRYAVWILKSKM